MDIKNHILISGKTVDSFPPPNGQIDSPLRARICDSWYSLHQGVICLIQVFDGRIKKGDKITSINQKKELEVYDLGLLLPAMNSVPSLRAGQVGYIITRSRETDKMWVGDTIIQSENANKNMVPLPGYSKVYSSIYPTDQGTFDILNESLKKLLLNDSSVSVERESSDALGIGFRCGFLGILHKDIFFERLQKEYDTDVIITAPSVPYTAKLKTGKVKLVEKSSDLPPEYEVEYYEEPMSMVEILTPLKYLKNIQFILDQKRGVMEEFTNVDAEEIVLKYRVPYNELIMNFYENILSVSSGYATIDYYLIEPQKSELLKVNIVLNKSVIDALSFISHRSKSEAIGRSLVEKLGKVIPRQQFEVVIQAVVGSKVIASVRKAPYRKSVLEKAGKIVGGGDQNRKNKLLNKQKEGKKKLKQVGNIIVPQEAFLAILSK